jgi:hypothetical protein
MKTLKRTHKAGWAGLPVAGTRTTTRLLHLPSIYYSSSDLLFDHDTCVVLFTMKIFVLWLLYHRYVYALLFLWRCEEDRPPPFRRRDGC